jgi:hypothetical protein
MTATLVILRDPAGILGREVISLHRDAPLQHQIEAAMPDGGAECELLINGERVDPMTDPRLDAPPQAGDCIVVAHRPAGVETWILVVSALLAVASYAMIPKPADTPVASDSPNNRLTGQTNVARAYQAIPDVYGRRRVWPDLIQPSYEEYVNGVKQVTEWLCVSRGGGSITEVKFADTLLSDIVGASYETYAPSIVGPATPGVPEDYPEALTATVGLMFETFRSPNVDGQELGLATAADALVTPATLFFNNTSQFTLTFADGPQWATLKALAPASSARVVFTWVNPTIDYGDTHDFTSNVVAFSVVGPNVTFTFNTPGYVFGGSTASGATTSVTATIYAAATSSNDVGPFTMTADGDQLWWNIVFLRGLIGSVQVLASWVKVDSAGMPIAGTSGTDTRTFTANSYDQQAYTTKVTPSGGLGRYRITFRRLTADLGNGADVAKLESLYAVRNRSGRTFPGVTVMRVTTRATQAATGVRERKFNCVFERFVRTLNSDTRSTSRNVFRAMAHLWTISGQSMAELDTAAMASINAALGESSPLLRFDGSLDDANVSLLERMQLMANHARCVFWRDGTRWTVTRDQARTAPELQLDYRNLAGGGQSVVNESFHLPASNDGVEVEFVDESTGAKKAYYRLNISAGAPVVGLCANPLRVKLPACTTLAQAVNRAQLEARKLLYQRTSITDTALGDAQQLGPGSLVRWVDPNDFAGDDGLQAGELLAVAGAVATLSEAPDFKGEASGRIQFTGADGMLLGPPVVCTPVAGAPYRVTLASVPAGLYVADGVTSQLGSRYAFAVGMTVAEMESAGLYTVTEPKPNGNGTWSLAMVNYDPRVYAAD